MDFKINDYSKEVLKAKEEAVLKFLEETGLHLAGEAQAELENDPRRVDTGLLRNSITYALDGQSPAATSYRASYGSNRWKSGKRKGMRLKATAKRAGEVKSGSYGGSVPEEKNGAHAVYVGTNVEYAIYVHEGTRRMTANRFLKNAFEKNMDQIKEKLKQALDNA